MPLSEKRKKHLARQEKKKAMIRTREERIEKIDEVYDNFSRTGFPPTPEIKKFFGICKQWIEDGQLREGIIPIPSLKVEICYTLNSNKRHEVGVMLRHIGANPPPLGRQPQQPEPVPIENSSTNQESTATATTTTTTTTTDTATDNTTDKTIDKTTDTTTDNTSDNT